MSRSGLGSGSQGLPEPTVTGEGRVDHYASFASLQSGERDGADYRRVIQHRPSRVAVVAIHGGQIEAGTSQVAMALAGKDHSLYCFEGIKTLGNKRLHICSTRFDDPDCIRILQDASTIVSVHGCRDETERCWVGGLDDPLAERIVAALLERGFDAARDTTDHAGIDPENVCNRGSSGRGIQLEIARGLRHSFVDSVPAWPVFRRGSTPPRLRAFADAVRSALAGAA